MKRVVGGFDAATLLIQSRVVSSQINTMDRNYIIRLDGARWYADADKPRPRHCLFSEAAARAICAEMQLYPETRGAEVIALDDDLADGMRPFILG